MIARYISNKVKAPAKESDDKYMFSAKYENARDSANPFKLARNSEAVPSDKFQIVDDEFESEERSPIKSNVDLKRYVRSRFG